MTESLKGRDYIETTDWSDDDIEAALSLSSELKEKFHRGEPTRILQDKTIFLLF